jgi:hypothetical protein
MKIKFVNEIPQWIISSDVAAYHPASKTIWIRNNLGWKTIPTLLHELTHWFIHKFLGNNEKLHSEAGFCNFVIHFFNVKILSNHKVTFFCGISA